MIKSLKNRINAMNEKKFSKFLFIFSMFFCLLIGILLSYNFNFTNNYNLLFDSDTSRVIKDMTELEYSHYRLKVHPLFVILTQPLYFLLKGIVLNKMLALVIISSLATSLTITFIYKILSIYNKNKKTNILLSLCYLFSFSNYIFTAGIEIYNIAVLFLVILWYYILNTKDSSNYSYSSYFIMSVLGLFSTAFTVTNIIIFLIILFLLLVFKKVKFKYLLLIITYTCLFTAAGVSFQNLIWHNTPVISSSNFDEENKYTDYNINLEKIINVSKNDYYNSIVSSDVYVKTFKSEIYLGDNYIISFKKINVMNAIIITLFYILLLILLFRNYKKDLFANIGIILALLFNTLLHIVYGNNSSFLYSLHFLYLIFICYGINLSFEKNKNLKKFCTLVLSLILLLELTVNNFYFIEVIRITKTILESNYFVSNFGLIISTIIACILITLILFLIYLAIKYIKKTVKEKNIDEKIVSLIMTFGIFIIIYTVFIALETTPIHNKILWINTGFKSGEIDVSNRNKYLKVNKEKLYKNYKEEIKSLKKYKSEYKQFLKEYSHKKVEFLNYNNYYFFGFGNRRKILYKDSKLIDLETNEKIYELNVKSSEIIPNIYTIVFETIDGDFIKIVEDNYGVHIITKNDDKIINGTGNYLNLYEFKNQKYQNIKKTLYSEILFNIKDSKIYPNILVYDKPWYRDAALATMVLKQTNNLDLISNWVNTITDIYDKQNKGNNETDNLGELLYILSTQKNLNYDLISKIKLEANRIATSNTHGNYLYGTTDFGNKYLYQNLWYKFGIESIGDEFDFSLTNLKDDYSSMVWWLDCNLCSNEEAIPETNFPYLSTAKYHKSRMGKIAVNKNIYPLSWERYASEAKYDNMQTLDNYYSYNKISPLHTWAASEMLLFLLDDSNDLIK